MFRLQPCILLLISAFVVVFGGGLNAQDLSMLSLLSQTASPHETVTLPIDGDHYVNHAVVPLAGSNLPFDCGCTSNGCSANQSVGEEFFQSPDEVTRSPWFVRLGVGVILFGEGSTLRINDTVVPGAGLDISDETTFAFDIGYQISPFWSVTFSAGVPPRLDLDGTGIFEGASYGTTLFAPIALTVQRHFYVTRKASIYVGAGINYNAQYESLDGLIENLDIENDAAVVLQLGVERRINNRISLFADAKKAFYRTQAFGNTGPATVRSDVTVNPTALTFGLRYNF